MPANALSDVRIATYSTDSLMNLGAPQRAPTPQSGSDSTYSFHQVLKDTRSDDSASDRSVRDDDAAPRPDREKPQPKNDKSVTSHQKAHTNSAGKTVAKKDKQADNDSAADSDDDSVKKQVSEVAGAQVPVQPVAQQTPVPPVSWILGFTAPGIQANAPQETGQGSNANAAPVVDATTPDANSLASNLNGIQTVGNAATVATPAATPNNPAKSTTNGAVADASNANAIGMQPIVLNPDATQNLPAGKSATSSNLLGAAGVSQKTDPIVLNTPARVETQAPALSANTLAFAMRLGNFAGTNGPAAAALNNSADASATNAPSLNALAQGLLNQVGVSAQKDAQTGTGTGHSNSDGGAAFASYVPAQPTPATETAAVANNDVSGTAQTAAPEPPNNTAANDPVRNMVLQLRGEDNRRIDVRLVNAGGEVHVSVRSADTELASRLQEHIPELTSRLDGEKISNEVFLPKITEPSKAENANTQDFLNSGNSGETYNGNANSRNQGQSGQGQGRPDWVDLLESQIS